MKEALRSREFRRLSHRSGGKNQCPENASEGAFASMNNRRYTYAGLLLAAVVSAILLTGCRAFEPEAVIVNKAPETFIIGAPLESGGGYYHFHVFWYGSDEDGTVERFVWALTDTSLQDPDTVDDEEDQNFNPALDATTLEIGSWTTKTDSIFNFTIDQGVSPSADMTLHMVAVDDFGDYDRTPARLHFFSNTLGNPEVRFFQITGGDTIPIVPGEADTVGYGFPFQVYWAGVSPNVRGYDPAALALVDTIFPYDDGLFGYKWQIMGDLGDNCVPSLLDCWHPRKFNEATGDSFSFFGPVTGLTFQNDGSGTSPFRKLLPSGAVDLQVNSIDIAGVEVANHLRPFSFVVNYDPQTLILNGEADWAHPSDPEVYPYYIQLNDPAQVHHPFVAGERIPDRSYVVFKALARDDKRDGKQDASYKIGFTGFMQGVRSNFTGGAFSFSSESSELNVEPTWDALCDTCWYADTLGFLTAPNTEFTMNMQAVDEHGRRDGSPANLSFEVGFPPCLQCVELLPKTSSTSVWNPSLECVDDPAAHPCFQDVTELYVSRTGAGPDELESKQGLVMLVDKQTYFVQTADNGIGFEGSHYVIPAQLYSMSVLLHGVDDPREAWSEPLRRSLGWLYQIDYECDIFNQIKDGGGNDDIKEATWGQPGDGFGLSIDPASGLWRLDVDVVVPNDLFQGPDIYKLFLGILHTNNDAELTQAIFDATTKQFGNGTVRAVTLDQTQCGINPIRPGKYNYFKKVRPPQAELPGVQTWRDCNLFVDDIKDSLPLSRGAMASHVADEAVVKNFRLVVKLDNGGEFVCELP